MRRPEGIFVRGGCHASGRSGERREGLVQEGAGSYARWRFGFGGESVSKCARRGPALGGRVRQSWSDRDAPEELGRGAEESEASGKIVAQDGRSAAGYRVGGVPAHLDHS